MKHGILSLTLITSGCLLLQACAPVILGGAATTATVIHDRRTTGSIVDDNTLEIKIHTAIIQNKQLNQNSNISVTGYNGNILLTGEAASDAIRQMAIKIAGNQQGVKQVYNRIIIGRPSSFLERSYDAKQTAKVKAVLFQVPVAGFDPSRIKVVTEHGVTYLLGLVSPQEGQAAATMASHVSGVREVVTLFEPPHQPQP